jgi:transcriptional regulator with XRE-family HTH domain
MATTIRIELDPESLTVIALRDPRAMPVSIQEAREQLGLSQQALADRAQCSRVHISNLECSDYERSAISLKLARRIASVLMVPIDAIFPED